MSSLRIIAFLFICTLGANVIFAQGILFEEGKWSDIVTKAKKSKQGIFVDVYTDWCGPCKVLAKKSFPDPEVGAIYNRQFINYKVNAEKGAGIALARDLNVHAYPTMLYFDPNGVLLLTTRGVKTPFALTEIAKLVASMKTDQRLVELLNKPIPALDKSDLDYLLRQSNQYHNDDKESYYSILYNQLSLTEKRDPVTSKLFLLNYGLLPDDNLKEQVIRNYQAPKEFANGNGDHIRLQHNLKNALITEEQLALREKDILGFRRKVDRRIHFLHKTRSMSSADTITAKRAADLVFYDYHNEVGAYSAAAKTLMEDTYLPILLKDDQRAYSGHQATLIKANMIIEKLIGHNMDDRKIMDLIIGWSDQLIKNTKVYEAFLFKARAYKAMDDLPKMKATIAKAKDAPISAKLRNDLDALVY